MRVAIYPGSFDPVTNGHLDIITRGSKVFDKLIVGVLVNVDKVGLFPIEERVELIKRVTKHLENVEVVSFNGLLVELAKKNNTQLICLSGLGGDSIYSRFENIYSLSLVPSSFKKGCSYMKSQHIKGEIDQHLLIPSRVYIEEGIQDQDELLF